MFEGLVSSLLTKYLGDFIMNLSKSDLNISVLGGDVVLENLQVRPDALDKMGIPIKLKFGTVGRLILKADWKKLKTKPVVAELHDVFLIVTTSSLAEYDAEEEAAKAQAKKAQQLQALELSKDAKAKAMEGEEEEEEKDTFASRLITKIVDNVQIRITNIHIRLEDDIPPNVPFAMGITLESLAVQSTNEQWVPAFLTEDKPLVNKLLELRSLAVYWDLGTGPTPDLSLPAVTPLMRAGIQRKGDLPLPHLFMVRPIGLTAKVIMNKREKPDLDNPKFRIAAVLDAVDVVVEDQHLASMLGLVAKVQQYQIAFEHRQYRPKRSVREAPREWWAFAIHVHVLRIRDRAIRWSPAFAAQRRVDKGAYIALYRAKKKAKKGKLPAMEELSLQSLEQRLDFDTIRLFRMLAERQVALEAAAKAGKKSGFSWFRRNKEKKKKKKKKGEGDDEGGVWQTFSSKEQAEICGILDYDEREGASLDAPPQYVRLSLDALVSQISVSVRTSPTGRGRAGGPPITTEGSEVVNLHVFAIAATVLQRPTSLAANATLQSIEVLDAVTGPESAFPFLVQPKADSSHFAMRGRSLSSAGGVVEESAPLVNVQFEQGPLSEHADIVLKAVLLPLAVIAPSPALLQRLLAFAAPLQSESSTLDLAGTVEMQVAALTSLTAGAGINYAVEQHKSLDVQLNLSAPTVLIPACHTALDTTLLIVDLGCFAVLSDLSKRGSVEKAHCYDFFHVALDHVQVLLAPRMEPWQAAQAAGVISDPMHILAPFRVDADLALSFIPDDPEVPKTKVALRLPEIIVHISTVKTRRLLALVDALGAYAPPPPPAALTNGEGGADDSSSSSSGSSGSSSSGSSDSSSSAGVMIDVPTVDFVDAVAQAHAEADRLAAVENIALLIAREVLSVAVSLGSFHIMLVDDHPPRIGRIPPRPAVRPLPGMPAEPLSLEASLASMEELAALMTALRISEINVVGVEVAMVQRTFDMTANAAVGSMAIVDYFASTAKSQRHMLLTEPRPKGSLLPGFAESAFAAVQFVQVQRSSPEFLKVHDATEATAVVSAGRLLLDLNPDTVVALLAYAKKAFPDEEPEAGAESGATAGPPPPVGTTIPRTSTGLISRARQGTLMAAGGGGGMRERMGTMLSGGKRSRKGTHGSAQSGSARSGRRHSRAGSVRERLASVMSGSTPDSNARAVAKAQRYRAQLAAAQWAFLPGGPVSAPSVGSAADTMGGEAYDPAAALEGGGGGGGGSGQMTPLEAAEAAHVVFKPFAAKVEASGASVLLRDSMRPLTRAEVGALGVQFTQLPATIAVVATVASLTLLDLVTPETLHRAIVVSDPAARYLQVDFATGVPGEPGYTGADMTVRAAVGPLSAVFVNQFVGELLAFNASIVPHILSALQPAAPVDDGPMFTEGGQLIEPAVAARLRAEREAAAKLAGGAPPPPPPPKIALDVRMADVELRLPRGAVSNDQITIVIGTVTAANSFVKTKSGVLADVTVVTVAGLGAAVELAGVSTPLLDNTTLTATITRPLEAVSAGVMAAVDAAVSIASLDASLTEFSFKAASGIAEDAFAETAPEQPLLSKGVWVWIDANTPPVVAAVPPAPHVPTDDEFSALQTAISAGQLPREWVATVALSRLSLTLLHEARVPIVRLWISDTTAVATGFSDGTILADVRVAAIEASDERARSSAGLVPVHRTVMRATRGPAAQQPMINARAMISKGATRLQTAVTGPDVFVIGDLVSELQQAFAPPPGDGSSEPTGRQRANVPIPQANSMNGLDEAPQSAGTPAGLRPPARGRTLSVLSVAPDPARAADAPPPPTKQEPLVRAEISVVRLRLVLVEDSCAAATRAFCVETGAQVTFNSGHSVHGFAKSYAQIGLPDLALTKTTMHGIDDPPSAVLLRRSFVRLHFDTELVSRPLIASIKPTVWESLRARGLSDAQIERATSLISQITVLLDIEPLDLAIAYQDVMALMRVADSLAPPKPAELESLPGSRASVAGGSGPGSLASSKSDGAAGVGAAGAAGFDSDTETTVTVAVGSDSEAEETNAGSDGDDWLVVGEADMDDDEPVSPPAEETLTVNPFAVRLCLLNDRDYGRERPAVAANVAIGGVSAKGWSSALSLTTDVSLSVLCLNPDTAGWQPLMEDWGLAVRMLTLPPCLVTGDVETSAPKNVSKAKAGPSAEDPQLGPGAAAAGAGAAAIVLPRSAPPKVQLSVVAERMLLINVTQSALRVLLPLASLLAEPLQSAEAERAAREQASYALVNEVGVDVMVWTAPGLPGSLVPAYQTVGFSFPADATGGSWASPGGADELAMVPAGGPSLVPLASGHRMVAIQLAGGWAPLTHVPVDQVGVTVHTLMHTGVGSAAPAVVGPAPIGRVVCEVKGLPGGKKALVVRSTATVVNATPVAVELRLEVADSAPVQLPTVQPGESRSLPLPLVFDARVRIRPATVVAPGPGWHQAFDAARVEWSDGTLFWFGDGGQGRGGKKPGLTDQLADAKRPRRGALVCGTSSAVDAEPWEATAELSGDEGEGDGNGEGAADGTAAEQPPPSTEGDTEPAPAVAGSSGEASGEAAPTDAANASGTDAPPPAEDPDDTVGTLVGPKAVKFDPETGERIEEDDEDDAAKSAAAAAAAEAAAAETAKIVASVGTPPVGSAAAELAARPASAAVFGVHTSKEPYPRPAFPFPQHVYRLFAPVAIENILAVPVEFYLLDQTVGVEAYGTLAKGEARSLMTIDSAHTVVVRLRPRGYAWSSPAVLFAAPTKKTSVFGRSKMIEAQSLTVTDAADRELVVQLMRTIDGLGETRKITFFVPFWIVNRSALSLCVAQKTGLRSYRDAAGVPEGGIAPNSEPVMFSFSPTRRGIGSSKQIALRFSGSKFSKAFSIESAGSISAVRLEALQEGENPADVLDADDVVASATAEAETFAEAQLDAATAGAEAAMMARGMHYELGLSINLGVGHFRVVKVVTLSPRFVIQSTLPSPIQIRQLDDTATAPQTLAPNTPAVFDFPHPSAPDRVQLRLSPDAPWSSGFDIDNLGQLSLKAVSASGRVSILRVDVVAKTALLHVVILPDNGVPPFRLVNETAAPITYYQEGLKQYAATLAPGASAPYAWDSLSHKQMLTIRLGPKVKRTYALSALKNFQRVKLGSAATLQCAVVADGPTRVFSVRALDAVRRATSNRKLLFEEAVVSVALAGVGLSLVDERAPRELLFAGLTGIKLEATDSTETQAVELSMGRIQINNTLGTAQFPVVFGARLAKLEDREHLHIGLVKSKLTTRVAYFHFANVLLQESDLQLEENWIILILDYLFSVSSTGEISRATYASASGDGAGPDFRGLPLLTGIEELCVPLIDGRGAGAAAASEGAAETQVAFDYLSLQSIKVNVTLQTSLEVDELGEDSPLRGLAKALGFALVNIDNAPLRLNSLIIDHVFAPQSQLVDRLVRHYVQQGKVEAYKIVGSFEVLGNPVGLFNSLSTGMADFFIEPAKGLRQSPKAFVKGIGKGSASLVKNTVYGVFNTASKITGSLGRGIGKLSFDDDYIADRAKKERARPKHAGYGLLFGLRDLGTGVFKGITGVVMDPLRGAKKDGAKGFIKGLGKGLVGLVVKPVAGALDLVTQTTEGIKNTTTYFEKKIMRLRDPRVMNSRVARLVRYDAERARGQAWLLSLESRKYASSEQYLFHTRLYTAAGLPSQMQLLIGLFHLCAVDGGQEGTLVSKVKVAWKGSYDEIAGLRADGRRLSLVVTNVYSGSGGKKKKPLAISVVLADERTVERVLAILDRVLFEHGLGGLD